MGGAGVCFLFSYFTWSGMLGGGAKGKAPPSDGMDEGAEERFARAKEKIKGKKRLFLVSIFVKIVFDFYIYYIYMLVPENTDIYGKWFFT